MCGTGREELLLERVAALIDRLIIGGPFDEPQPFMGPVIANQAADGIAAGAAALVANGAKVIRALTRPDPARPFLTPALYDVTDVSHRPDGELFGPFLQLIRVPDWDAAIREANATSFGLSAGLIGGDAALYDRFWSASRAGRRQLEPPDQRRGVERPVRRHRPFRQPSPQRLLRRRLQRLAGGEPGGGRGRRCDCDRASCMIREINFDGLIGPTHNYAALSFGNLASATNAGAESRPRDAALQGLGKMRFALSLGLAQGFFPPLERPNTAFLRAMGFAGTDAQACASAYAADPQAVRAGVQRVVDVDRQCRHRLPGRRHRRRPHPPDRRQPVADDPSQYRTDRNPSYAADRIRRHCLWRAPRAAAGVR